MGYCPFRRQIHKQNTMLNRALLSCLLIWLSPLIWGGIAAAYTIVLFRLVEFNPEIEPDYIVYVTMTLYFVGGIVGPWLIARILNFKKMTAPLRSVLAVTFIFVFCYIFIRSLTVESVLVSKYAYCCCCERVPTCSETYIRILSPINFH